jgi:hypothetical protein
VIMTASKLPGGGEKSPTWTISPTDTRIPCVHGPAPHATPIHASMHQPMGISQYHPPPTLLNLAITAATNYTSAICWEVLWCWYVDSPVLYTRCEGKFALHSMTHHALDVVQPQAARLNALVCLHTEDAGAGGEGDSAGIARVSNISSWSVLLCLNYLAIPILVTLCVIRLLSVLCGAATIMVKRWRA